jgi:hypothetical protein
LRNRSLQRCRVHEKISGEPTHGGFQYIWGIPIAGWFIREDPFKMDGLSPFMETPTYQWPFQEPKLEVPTIYKAYVREYSPKIWPYMVQYLHFRILKFPLTIGKTIGIKHPMTVMTNNHDIGIQPGTKSGEEASEMGICMGVVAKIGHIKLQFNGNMMINNESFGLVCSSKSTKPPCLYL